MVDDAEQTYAVLLLGMEYGLDGIDVRLGVGAGKMGCCTLPVSQCNLEINGRR